MGGAAGVAGVSASGAGLASSGGAWRLSKDASPSEEDDDTAPISSSPPVPAVTSGEVTAAYIRLIDTATKIAGISTTPSWRATSRIGTSTLRRPLSPTSSAGSARRLTVSRSVVASGDRRTVRSSADSGGASAGRSFASTTTYTM
ncbi:hypothetical protein D3C87_1182280 [compost metagenome]